MMFGSLPNAATASGRSMWMRDRGTTATCTQGARAARRREVAASFRITVPVSAIAPTAAVMPN